MDAATDAKSAVEDAQREERRKLEETGGTHVPRFFHLQDGRWLPKIRYVNLAKRHLPLLSYSPVCQSSPRPYSGDSPGPRLDLAISLSAIIGLFIHSIHGHLASTSHNSTYISHGTRFDRHNVCLS